MSNAALFANTDCFGKIGCKRATLFANGGVEGSLPAGGINFLRPGCIVRNDAFNVLIQL
jgi:hypothetical protein